MMRKRGCVVIAVVLALLSGLAFAGPTPSRGEEKYAVIVRGALIVDGTGAPGFVGDIAINGGKIVLVAPRIEGTAATEINAAGLVAAPGFIDIHSHSDGTILATPLSDSKLRQGVTTEVINNCGSGPFPLNPAKRAAWPAKYRTAATKEGEWFNLRQYAGVIQNRGAGVNLVPLVPHGKLRSSVMGLEDREPTETEMATMEGLLDEALATGAWGLSTGLVYVPGCYAKTAEIVRLARVVAKYDAVYASHVRGEGSGTGIDEAIAIGRESGARVQVSHLKATGSKNWGKGPALLAKLAAARESGVTVYADQYPYEASSTGLSLKIPQWARAGGTAKMLERLATPELQERIYASISKSMAWSGGPDKIVVITRAHSKENAGLAGKTLAEISERWQCSPEAAVVRLLLEEKGAVDALYFAMSEEDVTAILASTAVAVGSDGSGYRVDAAGNTVVHPRSYGTFAKVLGETVRERKILTLEQAVYKMTGLPAAILGLPDRGLLKGGYAADLVIFDPQTVAARAEYANPHEYAQGVYQVMVNGQWAVRDGATTGAKAGQVLLKGR